MRLEWLLIIVGRCLQDVSRGPLCLFKTTSETGSYLVDLWVAQQHMGKSAENKNFIYQHVFFCFRSAAGLAAVSFLPTLLQRPTNAKCSRSNASKDAATTSHRSKVFDFAEINAYLPKTALERTPFFPSFSPVVLISED